MSESAEVLSVQALRDLDDALARFAAQALQVPDAVAPEIKKRVMALEERRYEAAREVRYWEERYGEAEDDEDTNYIARRLEEAESELRNIECWQRRVEESLSAHQSAMASLKRLATDHTTKARTFLFQKEAELQAYLAAQPSHESPVSAGASTAQPDVMVSPSTRTANDAASVDNLPLPKGFRWVPLEEIDQSRLPGRKDFPEGSYGEFRHRLNLLRRKVLPVLKSKAHADRDHYHELDRRSGRVRQGLVHPDSLGRTYELFFGEDHIHLDRRVGDPRFDVTNGGHRIKVAKDLGWPAVPALAVETERKR